ncbi:MAG: M13 family metallopeptidase [Pseudomonadota bacterium]|nr:M13 family metallopeptidase [Pseudomonadota bacterium]
MKLHHLGVIAMCFFHAAAEAADAQPAGIELKFRDAAVRPQDDLYRYTSGKWLRETTLPADRGRFGAFDEVRDRAELQVRAIIEDLAARRDLPAGSEARKIADLYRSFMDEARIEKLDAQPLRSSFARIDALDSHAGLPALLGSLGLAGVATPFDFDVQQDERNSTRYLLHVAQAGLGLPDRDYYLGSEDELVKVREAYVHHVAAALAMAGEHDADAMAARVMTFETALARLQWTKVELRDPVRRYNKFKRSELASLAPGFDWDSFLAAGGLPLPLIDEVIVTTPSFFSGVIPLVDKAPLPDLKAYLKWQVLREQMPLLSQRFVAADFEFYGKTLRGIPENRPRWKRGVEVVEHALGEAVGKVYVERHFPPTAKARMDALVGNLLAAYRKSIDGLPWMGESTRAGAREKLARLTVKIGYPAKWRDYSSLEIMPDDLSGNVARAQEFAARREISHLGQPVDRDEWHMTPQTVNAYYNPTLNEIVFPAAILQPPFFNFEADDAVNYGGIGAVIGHEISHGFDDKGSQYDADGNLRDWFTPEDHQAFEARTNVLVAQYERYEPVKGYHVNGKLTLGENIADNSGLAISYKAYQLALGGKPAPVIDGLTGPQRLYMGWAQVWRGKARESEAIRLLKIDPHSPMEVRGNAPLVNQPGFYEAFGVKPGDQLYLPPEQRVTIW